MKTIREQENELFSQWIDKPGYTYEGEQDFVPDGVVDEEEWNKQDMKILFLLKEVNGQGHGWTLTDFLQDRCECKVSTYPTTWPLATRWIYGMLTGANWKEAYRLHGAEMLKWLSKIAVMNAKKAGGESFTKIGEYLKFFNQYDCAKLLAEQLKIYGKLDYIVCCGDPTYYCLTKAMAYLNWGDYRQEFIERFSYYVPQNKGTSPVIIDFYHPNCRVSHEFLYNTLVEIKRRTTAVLNS